MRTCRDTSRVTSHTTYPHATEEALTRRRSLRAEDISVEAASSTRTTRRDNVRSTSRESVVATGAPVASLPLSRRDPAA